MHPLLFCIKKILFAESLVILKKPYHTVRLLVNLKLSVFEML